MKCHGCDFEGNLPVEVINPEEVEPLRFCTDKCAKKWAAKKRGSIIPIPWK